MRTLTAVALAAALLLAVSGSALAKGGNGGATNSSSVWIVELLSPALASAPAPELYLGHPFTVGYQTNVQEPWALAQCYPNSTTVLSGVPYADGTIWGEWFSVYLGGPSPQDFVLGASVSPIWTGGGADCTVGLYKLSGKYNGALGFTNQTLLATYAFAVAP
jgi:hypothetical protein